MTASASVVEAVNLLSGFADRYRNRDGWEKTISAVDTVLSALTPQPAEQDAREAVAWRVKDYADGWILFHHEAPARKSAEARNGALVQPLYAVRSEHLTGEVTDEWADRFCEAVNWEPGGQECKTVEGELRCATFRQIAKGYILSAIATDPHPRLLAALTQAAPDGCAETVDHDRIVADLADELIYGGGLVNRGVDRGLVVVERSDKSDPHYRLCSALEARRAASPAPPAQGAGG